MPLIDIAVAQSSFQNCLGHSRVQLFYNGQIPKCSLSQLEDRCASLRKSFQNTGDWNSNFRHFNKKSHHKFLVKAVATFEPKCSVQSKDEETESNALLSTAESQCTVIGSTPSGDSEEVDEREKLRRMRISKANKGNTPWNKGRKHSPETRRRIKERTRLAMQDPKVKMKLAKVGHTQSQETRIKIAVGVRMGWKKRREKLLLQENCLFDWQNLIAEAARKGFQDEEELQWDSYTIINEQLKQEWLASIEERKMTQRPKASKRAPKSLEQRRKIAEAIAAKWADPEYRSRVSSGMAKYYKTSDGAERKEKRKASGGSRTPRTPKKKVNSAEKSAATEIKVRTQKPKLKKRTAPKYKDPLANSKLEMLKNIRAQRVASDARKNEALERAKLLIAEAQKAAKALEVAAMRSPVARASLIEARKLIAEATQSLESIENREATSQDDMALGQQIHDAENGEIPLTDDVDQGLHIGLNGTGTVFEPKTDGQICVEKDENSLSNDADQRLHRRVNGTNSAFVKKNEGQIQAEKTKIPITDDVNQGLHGGLNGSSTGFVHKTDFQIQPEKYESSFADDADQGHHIGSNGTSTGFAQKTDGSILGAGLYKMSMPEEMDMNHQLRRRLSGYEHPKLDIGSFIGMSELQELIDQQHLHELNAVSSHHHVTKLQVHDKQVPSVPAKRVTKKWVRGRLVEVGEGE